MAQTSAGRSPIPPANKEDSEDVAWALSTAEAMHARGDAMEALKWLRRAAEAAAESSADDRALQIAKAAADLASVVGPTSNLPPPPAAAISPVVPRGAPVPTMASVTAPAGARPLQYTQPTQQSRQSLPTDTQPGVPPQQTTPRAPTVSSPRGQAPARGVPPSSPNVARRSSSGRRSRPDVVISRPPDEATQQMEVQQPPAPGVARRRARASKPAPEEAAVPDTAPPTPLDAGIAATEGVSPVPPDTPSTDDMDAWPTQAMGTAALDSASPGDEKTRIGVPAYQPAAADTDEVPLYASQAVRVIVWRTADGGVRIAPSGTSVSAISVEAILVALDPSADLAAWLTGK
jgi:hypothetical protein